MTFFKPKGTYDILPTEVSKWQFVEEVMRDVAKLYGVEEIRTPIFEASELYHRTAGDDSDVVSKETYDFTDRGNRQMTLRPEGTAGIVRSFVENKLYVKTGVQKMFYLGPMFRYERQQKGRYRQHLQFGVELFGSDLPLADVEVISMASLLLKKLGLTKQVKVKLNSLGSDASRALYRNALVAHFAEYQKSLCPDCQIRFKKNPLRILDCKKDAKTPAMALAPAMIDYLIPEDLAYFNAVKAGLEALAIDYEYDHKLVRGFDYYTHTIFEIQANISGFGAQTTLCGGGRYNKLVEELGGQATPAVGFGMGLERVLLAIEAVANSTIPKKQLMVFFLPIGKEAELFTAELAYKLRLLDISCSADFSNRKLKAKFKLADEAKPCFTVVIGDDEVASRKFMVKNTKTKKAEEVAQAELEHYLKNELRADSEGFR